MSNGVPGFGASKGRGRQQEANRAYAYPLPILFSPPEPSTWLATVGLAHLRQPRVEIPQCEGYFDLKSRSVWVTNSDHAVILWRRGFFGKGSLSRSEPTWLIRRIHEQEQKAQKAVTLEEITASRRAQRSQFKRDRARAIAAAAAEAEAAFASGDTSAKVVPLTRQEVVDFVSRTADPDATSGRPEDSLEHESSGEDEPESLEGAVVENMEHLQLTLQEALFLLWCLDCLFVLDPDTRKPMTLVDIWISFQRAYTSPGLSTTPSALRFDNPFLVNYAVYHHYRSLGWVVRNGVKFCVDYLLYKRGPVFHHAEFALTVCPVYEDPEDRADSPFELANSTPFSWSWLSTINRVNTQVQKTLILAYITIPSSRRVSTSTLSSPACLAHYSVREVVLRRFVPARMRD